MGIKKKDILLACFLLFAACLLFFVLRPVKSGTGGWVRITVDGKLYGTYPLSGKEKIRIGQDSGYNMVYIEDGAAWISEADCPDGYCISQRKITGKGQVIVCLPHRLVLEVTGEESGDGKKEDLDAVVH